MVQMQWTTMSDHLNFNLNHAIMTSLAILCLIVLGGMYYKTRTFCDGDHAKFHVSMRHVKLKIHLVSHKSILGIFPKHTTQTIPINTHSTFWFNYDLQFANLRIIHVFKICDKKIELGHIKIRHMTMSISNLLFINKIWNREILPT